MEFGFVRRKSDSGTEVVSLTFIASSMHVGTIWKTTPAVGAQLAPDIS